MIHGIYVSFSVMLYFIERLYLIEDRELDVRKERYVFFSETSTSRHRNVVLHHTHTLTLTNTLTHTLANRG